MERLFPFPLSPSLANVDYKRGEARKNDILNAFGNLGAGSENSCKKKRNEKKGIKRGRNLDAESKTHSTGETTGIAWSESQQSNKKSDSCTKVHPYENDQVDRNHPQSTRDPLL